MTRALWLALGCLALLSGRARAQETWVVAIGNNDGDRTEQTLLFAERDASEVAGAFRMFGGVSGRRTTLLVGEQVEAVRRTLLDANTEIRAATSPDKPTTLVVFYSGHADADALHLDATRMPFDELRALVAGSPATVRILIVDSCRSGAVTRVKGVTPAAPFAVSLDDQSATEGVVIVTSSAAGESSQESDELRGSFFSHHFVNALRGAADRDGDGEVTLNEAYAYTYEQTLASTGRTLSLQHPTYSYDVKGRAPIVLARLGTRGVHAGTLRLAERATYLVMAQKSEELVAELTPDAPGARVALAEGSYLVQQRFPTEYRQYRVELARGREVDLARQPYEAIRYDRLVRKGGGARSLTHGVLALGSVRGQLVDEGASPGLVLGYTLDAPWSSLGLRVRAGRAALHYDDGLSSGHHDELAGGVTFARVLDLKHLSVGLGVGLEAGVLRQTRKGPTTSATRTAWSFGFGALASLERHLLGGAALRLEGGPMATLFRRAEVEGGAARPDQLTTVLTYWVAGGLLCRL